MSDEHTYPTEDVTDENLETEFDEFWKDLWERLDSNEQDALTALMEEDPEFRTKFLDDYRAGIRAGGAGEDPASAMPLTEATSTDEM